MILVVSISWLYRSNIHYKDVVKHSNVGQKFIYVLLALSPCVVFLLYRNIYMWPASTLTLDSTSWFSVLDLGLRVLASAFVMPPPLIGGALSDDVHLTSVCLPIAYIGAKLRTEA